MKLDKQQQAAVDSKEKKLLVIANAGAGKSRVLVNRIKRMIADGTVQPSEIAAVTFTNAGARELDSRLEGVKLGFIGTLHALCLRILSRTRNVVIIDQEQSLETLKDVMDKLKIKSSMKLAMAVKGSGYGESLTGKQAKEAEIAIKQYKWQLLSSGMLDYDMVLEEGLKEFRMQGELGDSMGINALFVDEYQDSGEMDAKIYEAIQADWKFYVGDDSQSIFSFRGGRMENIIALSKSTPTLYLETNYRSYAHITEAAQKLIAHNKNRIDKRMIPARGHDEEIALVRYDEYQSEASERMAISKSILSRIFDGGDNPNEIAVLARTNYICNQIAETLRSEGITIREKQKIEYPHDWSLCKAAFALYCNPFDDGAVYWFLACQNGKECANRERILASIKQVSIRNSMGFFTAHDRPWPTFLSIMGASIESIEMVKKYASDLVNPSNLDILAALTRQYESEEEGSGVTVTTIHGAKGREFETVFIAGCEQETIPGNLKRNDIEESRRLFYVAITRAKNELILTSCKRRNREWEGLVEMTPSQFIREASVCRAQ